MELLDEYISEAEELVGIRIRKDITLIPFGESGAGDLYCFLYERSEKEPRVILYLHDSFENSYYVGDDFDEFLYEQMLEAIYYGEDKEGEHFRENCNYLSAEYREMIEHQDFKNLETKMDRLCSEEAKIWKTGGFEHEN